MVQTNHPQKLIPDPPDHLGRTPHRHHIVGQIARHDAARTDRRSTAYCNPGIKDRSATDPPIVSDRDRFTLSNPTFHDIQKNQPLLFFDREFPKPNTPRSDRAIPRDTSLVTCWAARSSVFSKNVGLGFL